MAIKLSQNDLIALIASGVIALGSAAFFYFTQPQKVRPAEPSKVVTTQLQLPSGGVVMSNGLPSGGGGTAPGGGAGGGSPFGGGAGPGGGGISPEQAGAGAGAGGGASNVGNAPGTLSR